MPFDGHPNFAYSTVATAPSPATTGTSLVVQAGDGAKFGSGAVAFDATVWPTGVNPLSTNGEIVRVTNVSTDTLTIVRNQESSSNRSIQVGDQIAVTVTRKVLTDVENATTTGIFGDGSDGVVNFDGTTVVLGLTPSANTYTLARDIYLADGSQLTNANTRIVPNGYRIFCTGTLTLAASTFISQNGANGATPTAGFGNLVGVLGIGSSGGPGIAGAGAGSAGNTSSAGCGGAGGAGGATTGSGGTGGGAAGGTVTAPAANAGGIPRNLLGIIGGAEASANATTRLNGGAGAGGGASVASSTSGGGGAGGGVVVVAAKTLVNNGAIQATGGNGGAASGTGTGAGGGGGGGGGVIFLLCGPNSTIGTTQVAGGSGGAFQGAGNNGAAGSAGTVVTVTV